MLRVFWNVLAACVVSAGLAAPALANPAVHNSSEGCSVVGDYEYCFVWSGLFSPQWGPSGNDVFPGHSVMTLTITNLVTGEIVERYDRGNSVALVKDETLHVSQGVSRTVETSNGVTCVITYNVVYANGAERHHVYDVTCG